ncbi:MAG: Holliday junction branch migration protein RuvA [Alphaproteobacteria bacterium]|jgi:Holliday junction DNA helicase RuvA|nr:Holliday junction branch migration protein RuvA [Alphaproteobacteria bacterium]MDP6515945.1 Holliday junction branch migration protein RuvA [Alphaproteobacteria bacterium]
MIAKLGGRLDSVGEDWAVIDTGGVGYLVYCSGHTLRRLPGVGEAVRLHVETHVREDHIHLFGFLEPAERDWFRVLQTVQGVGARVALGLLSTLGPGELATAIAAQDRAALTRASGIGPKVAGRILSELKDRAAGLALGPVAATTPHVVAAEGEAPAAAISALVNLGYGRAEAFGAVAAAAQAMGGDAEVTALIRAGLKELSA